MTGGLQESFDDLIFSLIVFYCSELFTWALINRRLRCWCRFRLYIDWCFEKWWSSLIRPRITRRSLFSLSKRCTRTLWGFRRRLRIIQRLDWVLYVRHWFVKTIRNCFSMWWLLLIYTSFLHRKLWITGIRMFFIGWSFWWKRTSHLAHD